METAPLATTQTQQQEPTTNEPATGSTILTESTAEPTGAPEAYEPFTFPEGLTPPPEAIADASAMLKEFGLNQTQAQRMIDFHMAKLAEVAGHNTKAVETMRNEWRDQVKADPEIGGKLDQVKQNIGRALSTINDAPLVEEFKSAMNLTGAGDNLAFIKVFNKLATMVTEGSHVTGGGPSAHGQRAPGSDARPSSAQAMYPNLPH